MEFWGGDYEISDVRFVAHEVQLDATFYDRLRASVAQSNGVLTMAGTTYRHYLNFLNAGAGQDVTITTRVKSLKALLTRPQDQALVSLPGSFTVSAGQNVFMGQSATGTTAATAAGSKRGSYQYRIGSTLYPATAVLVDEDNIGEVVQEVRKAFGTIGDYGHGTLLNATNMSTQLDSVAPASAGVQSAFVFGCDFESFSKTATESGINTSDRALNVSIQMIYPTIEHRVRLDTYAMCDCLLYIGIDGRVTSRI